MSINVNEDVIGGGGIGGGWGGVGSSGLFIFAILIIFVFAIFWGRGNRDGGLESHAALLPALMNGHGPWGKDGCSCPPICKPVEDVALATLSVSNANEHGQIKTQNAIDTGAVIHAIDQQSCDIKIGEMEIIRNQTALAHEAEIRGMTNALNEKNIMIASLQADIRADRSDAKNAAQFSMLGFEIANVRNNMLRQPPFYAAGGTPYVNPFNFQHAPVLAVNPHNGCCNNGIG